MPDSSQIAFMQSTAEALPSGVVAPEPSTLASVLGAGKRYEHGVHRTRGSLLRRILVVTDTVALLCAFVVAELAVGFQSTGRHLLARDILLLGVAIPAWIVFARAHNLYHVDSRRADHSAAEEIGPILWMTTLWSWSILLISSLTGFRTISVPKLLAFWCATVVSLIALRSIARAWARRQSWYRQNAIVVGTLQEAGAVVPKILRHPQYGMDLLACVEYSIGPGQSSSERIPDLGAVPVLRGDVDLVELLSELEVDRVIFGPSVHRVGAFKDVLSEIRDLHVHVDMIPGWYDVVGSRVDLHELEGMPLIAIPELGLARSSLACKRLLDVTVAAVGLVLLSPLLAFCAVAIKLDSPGPILFRQRRVGRDDRRIDVLKFRSMRCDADGLKDCFADLNFHGGGNIRGMFKIDGDPRVTRVGRTLRRLSLDELPQLVNVLRGEMSLVGPRPLIENEDSQVAGRHRRRITLTPGLTGLWQVSGRSNIPFEGMIDLDYLYVTNWSLWGDVKLLIRTFAVVVRGHGAY